MVIPLGGELATDGNTATDNERHGFLLVESGSWLNPNILRHNVASDNGEIWNEGSGFKLKESHFNHLMDNVAFNNGASWSEVAGFRLQDSNRNELVGNSASKNGRFGFELANSHRNELVGNSASNNFDTGFLLMDSRHNTLEVNIAALNRDGFFIDDSSDENRIEMNQATANTQFGFHVRGHDNYVINNHAMANKFGYTLGAYGDNVSQDNLASFNDIGALDTDDSWDWHANRRGIVFNFNDVDTAFALWRYALPGDNAG